MDLPSANKPAKRRFSAWLVGSDLPPWLMSVVLHAIILLMIGLSFRPTPQRGVATERTADVGIALKSQEGDYEYYDGGQAGHDSSSTESAGGGQKLAEFLSDEPADADPSLPAALNAIGASVLGEDAIANAGGLPEGPRGQSGSMGGKARVTVFGATGEGRKFAYVFDRSGSMGGSGRNPLGAAKAELIASLDSLDTVHQFQIIFYNETPRMFNPSGQPGKLAFGTEENKQRAIKFVNSITAAGATRHEDALLKAFSMQPDVIFFLTDADEPRLSAGRLYDIHRRAAGITIHAIEFGLGPQRDSNNFLVKLARQNGGQHQYVDVTELVGKKRI